MEMSYELWNRDLVARMSALSDFDPHALAMALQLADLLDVEGEGVLSLDDDYRWTHQVSAWLRAEVARELGSQP